MNKHCVIDVSFQPIKYIGWGIVIIGSCVGLWHWLLPVSLFLSQVEIHWRER